MFHNKASSCQTIAIVGGRHILSIRMVYDYCFNIPDDTVLFCFVLFVWDSQKADGLQNRAKLRV
jgi:hypothetical protein